MRGTQDLLVTIHADLIHVVGDHFHDLMWSKKKMMKVFEESVYLKNYIVNMLTPDVWTG